jgi:hypothetical protein
MRRARYRLGQFRAHLWPSPLSPADLAEVRQVLSPPLAALFRRLTPGEQAHSLRVMRMVAAGGSAWAGQSELLQAALLHDVGKSVAPLTLPGRVAVVLVSRLWPELIERSAGGEPRGRPNRPFVTAAWHAEWGAELCAQAGAPPLTVELIRRHQTPIDAPATREDEMLHVLQTADDDN